MFIAGIINYVERTRASRLACLENFRDSILKQPDPGANYAILMEDYASKREAQLPTRITEMAQTDEQFEGSDVPTVADDLNNLEVVHYAYKYFQVFTGLVVDLIFINRELYETTFGHFYFQTKKDEFHAADIRITYTMLLGAIALDVISFLMLISSDRIFASIGPHSLWAALFCNFLAFRKPRWHPCKCEIKNSGSEKNNFKHHVLANPLACRRWSGSVSAQNLIGYCLKSSSTTIHEFPEKSLCPLRNLWKYKIMSKASTFVRSIQKTPVFRKITMPIKDYVDKIMYASSERFIMELWAFIFGELRNKSEFADTPEIAQRVSSARGDWVLADNNLLKYVSDVQYDESLLLWHIATDLCYYTDDKKVTDSLHREFSKILSDYMLYLLVFQPTVMSAVAGPNEDKKACEEILSVNTDYEPVTVKGNRSKSVLFELVSYESNHCKASTLAKEVSNGRELISAFWLLMAHYGTGAQFRTTKGHAGETYLGKVDDMHHPIFVSLS
ncbi:uncharacterized protein LOC111314701 [Durio zibethinus]|uniref:Uncharacterized protein LOC111314701 n=1 Tax=Durio zibethinus TaxID=66656 RepID=A0A6P6B4G5_DURZI|nr:uncharacterized protein LOC111314701 [Durio zibethinus]